jgi:hypothetical protein
MNDAEDFEGRIRRLELLFGKAEMEPWPDPNDLPAPLEWLEENSPGSRGSDRPDLAEPSDAA